MFRKNPNSVLFLYEGDTDYEFYSKLFGKYIPHRTIRISLANLHGVWNLNKKVRNRVNAYLADIEDEIQVSIIIAHDRDGNRQKESRLNVELLNQSLTELNNSNRVNSISEIIATQDIETWFLKDIEGIYKFLRVPQKERNNKYSNPESFNNRDLSKLFRRYNKHYQKGSRTEGFIDSLDLEKIYRCTPELQQVINHILSLINK